MTTNKTDKDLYKRGFEFYQSQNWQQAIECFQQILDSEPSYQQAQLCLGFCYARSNQPALARDYFSRLIDNEAYQLQAVTGLLQIGDPEQSPISTKAVTLANKILSDSAAVKHNQRIQLNFALGHYFDKTTEYDSAFHYFKEANDLKQISSGYDKKRHTAYTDRIISVFNSQLFKKINDIGIESDLPVFLVGTPRTGKSITEHLLKKNPKIAGAGEVQYLPVDGIRTLEKRLQHHGVYPESIKFIQRQDALSIANQYITIVQQFMDDKTRKVLDTMPASTMNMGTISILFPNASVIFCTRDPMDVAVEIYFKNFARGHDYSSSLENITSYINDYRRLTEHWLNLLPIKMTQVKYEQFTANPVRAAEQLFGFLGINSVLQGERQAWDHYEGQAINQNQIACWKNYDAFLSPLKDKLLTT